MPAGESVSDPLVDGNEPEAEEEMPALDVSDDEVPHVSWDPSYLPKSFSGKIGQDFEQWCKKLELAISTYTYGAPSLSQALGSCLSDQAFDYWDQLPDNVKENFSESKKRLSKVFGKATQNRKVRDFSYTRPRYPGESLEIYLAALSKIVNTAFTGKYDYGDVFKMNEIKRRFIEGLSTNLRTKCLEQGPDTVKEALEIAKRLEFAETVAKSQQNLLPSESVCSIGNETMQSKSDSACSEVLQLTNMVATLSSKIDNMEKNYRYSQDNRGREVNRRRYSQSNSSDRCHSPHYSPSYSPHRTVRFDDERGRSRERYRNVHFKRSDSFSPNRQSYDSRCKEHNHVSGRRDRYNSRSNERSYCESCSRRLYSNSPSARRHSQSPNRRDFRHNVHYDRRENADDLNMQGSRMLSGQRPIRSSLRK